VLDHEVAIYVSVLYVASEIAGNNNQPPACFGEGNCLPYLTGDMQEEQEGYKNIFLLKYDTEYGNLQWRKDYQGNVSYYNGGGFITDLQIDSSNVLHTIIGLQDGVHLDGALTVELDEDESVKLYLVKFNSTTGDLIGTPLLLPLELAPLASVMDNTSFRYNEILNRYYLAGWRYGSGGSLVSFNGITFGEASPLNSNNSYAYFLSFNPDNLQDWWYREFTGSGNPQITGIEIDDNSDIYIGGKYFLGGSSGNTVAFGDYTFTENDYSGNRPYILKMNSDGEVQWSSIPTGYINPVNETSHYFAYDVGINGNEVALATHGSSTIWGNFSMNRPSGHQHDPYLVRFNKQTGEVIGLHDIYGSGGYHGLTAVTTDQDGNYVVGGAMRYSLFTDNPNGIPTLYNTGSGGSYTDFFMARLAATECGTNVASNNSFEQQ